MALFLFGITLQPFARQLIVEALLVNELTKAKMREGKRRVRLKWYDLPKVRDSLFSFKTHIPGPEAVSGFKTFMIQRRSMSSK